MDTTLGATAAAVTDQLGAEEPAWATSAAELAALVALVLACAAVDGVPSTRVTAYVPVLARMAARAAMAPSSANRRGLPG
jgi:hypothetical protein